MLSVDQCRQYLENASVEAEDVEKVRESLYQLANILVDEFIRTGRSRSGNAETD